MLIVLHNRAVPEDVKLADNDNDCEIDDGDIYGNFNKRALLHHRTQCWPYTIKWRSLDNATELRRNRTRSLL